MTAPHRRQSHTERHPASESIGATVRVTLSAVTVVDLIAGSPEGMSRRQLQGALWGWRLCQQGTVRPGYRGRWTPGGSDRSLRRLLARLDAGGYLTATIGSDSTKYWRLADRVLTGARRHRPANGGSRHGQLGGRRPPHPIPYLDVLVAAKQLGMTPATLRQWLRRHQSRGATGRPVVRRGGVWARKIGDRWLIRLSEDRTQRGRPTDVHAQERKKRAAPRRSGSEQRNPVHRASRARGRPSSTPRECGGTVASRGTGVSASEMLGSLRSAGGSAGGKARHDTDA